MEVEIDFHFSTKRDGFAKTCNSVLAEPYCSIYVNFVHGDNFLSLKSCPRFPYFYVRNSFYSSHEMF
jgi:hypothetical protein